MSQSPEELGVPSPKSDSYTIRYCSYRYVLGLYSLPFTFSYCPPPSIGTRQNEKGEKSLGIFLGVVGGFFLSFFFSYKKHSSAGRSKATRSRHCWVTTEIIIALSPLSSHNFYPVPAFISFHENLPLFFARRISVLIGGAFFGACPFRGSFHSVRHSFIPSSLNWDARERNRTPRQGGDSARREGETRMSP